MSFTFLHGSGGIPKHPGLHETQGGSVVLLREALGVPAGPIPAPAAEYHDLAWRAIEESPTLDYRRAGLVRKAFALGGTHTVPVPWIIDWLLVILRDHAKKRGIPIGP